MLANHKAPIPAHANNFMNASMHMLASKLFRITSYMRECTCMYACIHMLVNHKLYVFIT